MRAERKVSENEITAHLVAVRDGGRAEIDALFSIVYDRLHRLARLRVGRAAGRTLDATALVHEVFLRFVDGAHTNFQDRQHFFATAARAMRQIVLDHARKHAARKRGGDAFLVTLHDVHAGRALSLDDLLIVDRALTRLADSSPRLVTVVELCFFAGMTTEEAGDVLGLSARTVKREWQKARLLLRTLLGGPGDDP
jgi:RNA polymerase sigma factor (TIGR02999 family)